MPLRLIFRIIFGVFVFIVTSFILFSTFQYFSKAASVPANIVVDTRKVEGLIPQNWSAFAQGGEESGVRMLGSVIPEVAGLFPSYIRIDHIYDFYDVVSRDPAGNLIFNWDNLDATVCDIYHTGARPFFSLGYMPKALSKDGSLISIPNNWDEWSSLVQKTIERYSGMSTRICNQVGGLLLKDIYYEVWNEPDLETFGKWSIWGGQKDYKTLYFYSSIGASRSQNVYHFFIGGPAITAPYQTWFQNLLTFINTNNLRLDFLSWHHYSKNADDFSQDVQKINSWLSPSEFERYRYVQKIVSEWGYDSNPNQVADTTVGAAHTVASIRNLIEQNVAMAFAFEIKDGKNPSWGFLNYNGGKKPRYFGLQLLNHLDRQKLSLTGEGTYVKAIASNNPGKISVVLVNYDDSGKNTELVPLSFINLTNGTYQLVESRLGAEISTTDVKVFDSALKRAVIMPPNSVVAIDLIK